MKLIKNTFSLSFMASWVMCFFTFHWVVETQDTVFSVLRICENSAHRFLVQLWLIKSQCLLRLF